ncbi:heterokaryon incompatibility protein-domain-containing protein [Hypoxylon rubiginosum]|uniref:Heterokaryon incompatibility protein-domain-containing protein n=1 Tax=Hypoxylon rubiginosum TaxID=110542 RepID=A0ACB9YKE7_9PEZI|nr:heterokaryon incompatibility protein-domain-containing protein [Hypoxylon rubiginosum]
MPLAEESSLSSGDPTAATRWSYRDPSDPSDPALADDDDDDPSQPFCARHAATIARLTRASFGPHPLGAAGLPPPPLRDWHFGKLDDVLARRARCRVCALIADTVDTVAYGDQAEVIACWVWDGVLKGDGERATLRLRVAPEMVGWESSFEPFDLVPLDVSAPAIGSDLALFTGRPVAADRFDMAVVRSWIKSCSEWHGTECVDTTAWRTSDWGVPFIRLISLAEDRLIESASPPPYAALSYVWGSAPVFKTLQGNIRDLMKPGALASQQFPKTIRDAMSLARTLGFDFLWVDSICIVQDSPDDKAQQIGIMDGIYSRAHLTIVAAAGAHADAGIPGLEPGTRSLPQRAVRVSDELTLAALHADSHRGAAAAPWSTRGWTYQERLLSRRCLLSLPDGAVGYQCARAVWGEDYRAETPRLARCAPMTEVALNRSWMDPGGGARERGSVNVRTRRTPYLREYSRLVEEYTGRKMTFASDRLLGVNGVLDVLRRELGLRFVQGLPEAVFHMALLWQPRNRLKRVPKDERTGLPLFPSWSWGGWVGPVGYEDWNEFNGLPELEERERRVIPFAELDTIGSAPLEAYSPSKSGGKLPTGWSKVTTASDGICYVSGDDVERFHSVPFISAPASPGPPGAVSRAVAQPSHLRLRTRIARFRLTNLIRTFDMNRSSAPIEQRGRFGLASPSPATSDQPWLGTILLPNPASYHTRLALDYEFVVLSEGYGFSRQEAAPSFAGKLEPFAVFNVMMIRRVAGDELEKYRARFSKAAAGDVTGTGTTSRDLWNEPAVVERAGVGRMLKSAWEDTDVWESFILV